METGIIGTAAQDSTGASTDRVVQVKGEAVVPGHSSVAKFDFLAIRRGDTLRWELRRVLPAVGYPETPDKRKTQLTFVWKRLLDAVSPLGALLELEVEDRWGPSEHSARCMKGARPHPSRCEQNHWLDTEFLIMILVWLPIYVKNPEQRKVVVVVLRLFLEKVLNEQGFPEFQFHQIEEMKEFECDCVDRNETNECALLDRVLEQFSAVTGDLQGMSSAARVTSGMQVLIEHMSCSKVRLWLQCVISTLAGAVEGLVEEWADTAKFDTEHLLMGPNGKRRRICRAFKEHAVQHALTECAVMSTGRAIAVQHSGVHRTMGIRMEQQRLLELKGARFLHFHSSRIMSLAIDGAKIGKPAKQLCAGVLVDCVSGHGAVFTPQVPPCFLTGVPIGIP